MHRDASAPTRPRVTGEGAVSGNLSPPLPPTASSSGSVFNSASGSSSSAGAGSGSSGGSGSASGNSGVSSGISAAPFAPLNGSAVNYQIVRKTSPNAVYNSAAAAAAAAAQSTGDSSSSAPSSNGSSANGSANGNSSVGEEESTYLSLPAGVHAALVSRLVREVTEKAGVAPGAAAALDAYSDPFAPFAAAAPQYGYPSASAAAATAAAAAASAATTAASRRGSAVVLPNSPGARAAAKLSSAFALPSSMLPSMPTMPGGMSMPAMPSMMPGFFANNSTSSSSKHGSGSGTSSRPSSLSPPHGRSSSTSTSSTTSAAGLDADVIRDAFLCAMVDLLGDLGEHMLPGTGGGGTPGFGWGDISTTPLNSLFDTGSFLEKAEQVSRPFVEALSKSQVSTQY
jgi:hypothetical protein